MPIKKEVTIGDCRLILGDCTEIMPTLGRVDAVVTDPPYGINESGKKNKSRGRPTEKWRQAKPTDYGDYNWDTEIKQNAINLAREISDWQVIFGGNYYTLPPTSCWLVWYKDCPQSHFSDAELAWTNLTKAVRHITWLWDGFKKKQPEKRVHPTQKPLGVIEWCITHLPKETVTICDPFMGSGTTLVACAKMGRKGIGIELDEDYFNIAVKRVEEAYKSPDMFVEAAKVQPVQEGMDI